MAVGDCDHREIVGSRATRSATGTARRTRDAPAAGALPQACAAEHRAAAERAAVGTAHRTRRAWRATRRTTTRWSSANTILGGQFVSRINLNLREDKGVTYGARTAFEFRRLPGPFALQVSVQTSATAHGDRGVDRRDRRDPRTASGDGRGARRSASPALTRGYARNFETAEQIARAAMQLALYDLPDDYFAQFVPRIERVTSDDVSRVMEPAPRSRRG